MSLSADGAYWATVILDAVPTVTGASSANTPSPPTFAATKWTDVVGALGPFIASGTALGIAIWSTRRDRSQRPKLTAHFDPAGREDFATGSRDDDGHERHWLRLRVVNARGKRTAEDVEVLFLDLESNDPADAIVRVRPVSGRAFRWTHHFSPDGTPVTRIHIAPGAARHFDLLGLREPTVVQAESGKTPAYASLLLFPPASDPLRYALPAGTYRAIIAITARDTDATYYSVDVDFDGLWWSDPEVRQHIRIRLERVRNPPLPNDAL